VLPTPVFFFGHGAGRGGRVEIEPGKTLIIKFLTVGEPHADGKRTVFFELNGQPRDVTVVDRSLEAARPRSAKADPATRAGRRRRCRAWWSTVAVRPATVKGAEAADAGSDEDGDDAASPLPRLVPSRGCAMTTPIAISHLFVAWSRTAARRGRRGPTPKRRVS
jgi:hypothetical protein